MGYVLAVYSYWPICLIVFVCRTKSTFHHNWWFGAKTANVHCQSTKMRNFTVHHLHSVSLCGTYESSFLLCLLHVDAVRLDPTLQIVVSGSNSTIVLISSLSIWTGDLLRGSLTMLKLLKRNFWNQYRDFFSSVDPPLKAWLMFLEAWAGLWCNFNWFIYINQLKLLDTVKIKIVYAILIGWNCCLSNRRFNCLWCTGHGIIKTQNLSDDRRLRFISIYT